MAIDVRRERRSADRLRSRRHAHRTPQRLAIAGGGIMKVFVAGASGTIGVPLVRALVAAGHDVTAMTRAPGKQQTPRSLGATPVPPHPPRPPGPTPPRRAASPGPLS